MPIHVPDEVLADLGRRLARTRWFEDTSNDDWYYGVNGGPGLVHGRHLELK